MITWTVAEIRKRLRKAVRTELLCSPLAIGTGDIEDVEPCESLPGHIFVAVKWPHANVSSGCGVSLDDIAKQKTDKQLNELLAMKAKLMRISVEDFLSIKE